jgi:Xaa-Pro aminopeptidase
LEHPYPIKEGQVFAIETETGIGDGQGVRIEEMVVVTKTGYEVLTKAPLEIITVPLR